MKNLKRRALSMLIIFVSLIDAGGFYSSVVAQRRSRTTQTSVTADSLLSLGNFYYKNNDITDKADHYYKQLIVKYPDMRQAGLAQFNRGAYWHGKYNMLRQKSGEKDRAAQSALVEAEGQYYDFIDKFAARTGTVDLLADAEFNLALVYLQKNRSNTAVGWLNVLLSKANKDDPQIHIYRVVWSSDPSDIIDRMFDSTELAQFARSVIGRKDLSTDQIISQLKQWCLKH